MAFSIICTKEGKLREIVDNSSELGALDIGVHFKDIVASGSRTKAEMLLSKIIDEQLVYNWEINVNYDGVIRTFLFTGIQMNESILLMAAPSLQELHAYYETIMRVNNEKISMFRHAIKEAAKADQSKRKRMQEVYEELMRLNNELSSMQRQITKKNQELESLVELKNQFLGMLAHDLRNPLGAIQMASEYVRTAADDRLEETEIEFLEQIEDYTEYMKELVEEALDLSAVQSGKMELNEEETSIIDLVEDVLSMLRPIAEKKSILIDVEEKGKSGRILIDKNKISQVIQNLVSNAIKYSHPDSHVSINIKHEEEKVIIEVIDEGQGIPEEEIPLLFKPFTKTSVKTTGGEKSTGLGLAISKRIVDEHNGEIWATSEVGKGSQFNVILPKKKKESS